MRRQIAVAASVRSWVVRKGMHRKRAVSRQWACVHRRVEACEQARAAHERGGGGGDQRTIELVVECGKTSDAESGGDEAGEARRRGRRRGINETRRDKGIRGGIKCRLLGE